MRVKFHDICDRCGAHSAEYDPWYTCKECHDCVCKDCAAEHDDETATAYCRKCKAEDADRSAFTNMLIDIAAAPWRPSLANVMACDCNHSPHLKSCATKRID